MSSTGVNVLRWSALGLGVLYGVSHQRTIRANERAAHEKHEYEHKQKLIEQAKAEFNKRKNPKAASGDDVVTDVQDPRFDLEKYLLKVAQESP